jgi:hypothetical protein
VPNAVFADTEKYLLWVGNSFFYYNNGINQHVRELIRAHNPASAYRGTAVTISGSGLDWHDMEAYFHPNAIGRYAFNEDNTVSFSTAPPHFDAVVMMDSSQGPIHPKLQESFHRTVAAHCKTARKNGTVPILFMSWAYSDHPEMTEPLVEQYTRAASATSTHLIPAGLAFSDATRTTSADLYQPDRRHPSLAGTYLAACATYASVFGLSPVGLGYTAGLAADLAFTLQKVAQRTVLGFQQPTETR